MHKTKHIGRIITNFITLFLTNSVTHFFKQGFLNISNTIGQMVLKLAHNNFEVLLNLYFRVSSQSEQYLCLKIN